MEATQVKPETTVAPPEGPGKKSPQLTPPKLSLIHIWSIRTVTLPPMEEE